MTTPLSDEERAQLSMRADEFHSVLIHGGSAEDWTPFLAGLQGRVRRAVLTELTILDLIHRWEKKERPEVEEYVRRHPELGPIDEVPNSVIVEEFRCRVKAREQYEISRYQQRFPVQFPQIQKQLEAIPNSGTVAGTVNDTMVGSLPAPGPAAPVGRESIAGDFEFVKVLGRGVFGEVWLARKKTSGIEKAIKIVTQPEEKDAAKRERRSLELIKNLHHPYLLTTEDFWVADHRLHIVMELADSTLRNRMEQCQREGLPGIPEGELLGYIREAAEGLDFLHSRHVVHRDVKPDNILILNGHAKVADFGLAWQQDKLLAPMKTFAGTPAYMAPEIWGKEGGPASDQYSLAITYIELRQGRPPMHGEKIEEMMSAHMEGSHVMQAIIGPAERKALAKALERMPEDRYSSCLAFADELAASLGISVFPRSKVVPLPSPRKADTDSRHIETLAPGAENTLAGSSGSKESKRTLPVARSGTVVDAPSTAGTAPPQPPAPADSPPAGRRKKSLLAAILTLGLLGIAAVAAWALLWKGETQIRNTQGEGTSSTAHGNTSSTTPGPGDPVRKTPGTPLLPPRAEPDPTDGSRETLVDGRELYRWVVVPVKNERVRFRLITGSKLSPYYMMESKVWNALARDGGLIPDAVSDANGPDAPVIDVTAAEAAKFARDVFDGKLPSVEEWDVATGKYAGLGRADVTRADGKPRVMTKKPKPTHGPLGAEDVDHFGLRDMAGNGREWTRTVLGNPGEATRTVGASPLQDSERVILRGRNYTLSRGLTFEMLERELNEPQAQYAGARSPYTSFRVVIYP
jgi:serine/threonine protein kinase